MPSIITITLKRPEMVAKCSRGFSLLELSMVLLIMSLILGTTLGFLAEKTDADKIKETERRMDKIEQAIAQFVVQNKRLPCPSPSSVAIDSASFGVENLDGPKVCYSEIVVQDPFLANMGAVPTKTLQISDEYAFDAWGRRIDYHVNEECISVDKFPGLCLNVGYTIRDKATNVIVILVSHGKNGHGAYPHHGGTTRVFAGATVSADEVLNGRLTGANAFQLNNGVFVQRSRTNDFDDIVRYKTRIQIVKETGGMKGMGVKLVPPDDIDPLCRMIDSKMGAVYPTVIPKPNVPLQATVWSICGLTTGPQQTASSCDNYMLELAEKAYAFCL